MNASYSHVFSNIESEERFRSMVISLYRELVDHPEIAFHFVGVDIESLVNKQALALRDLILNKDIGKLENHLRKTHLSLGITDFQYDQVLHFFRFVFEDHGVQRFECDLMISKLEGLRSIIVTKKESPIDSLVKPFYRLIDYCLFKIGRRRI